MLLQNPLKTTKPNPWTMPRRRSTDWAMTGCCFSFWVACLGSALPSFLPSRFQLCLSLVSSASSQRRGPAVSLDYIKRTPDAAAGRQAGTREALLSSVTVYHQNTDLERAVLHRWGGVVQVGRAVSQHAACSLSVCSSLHDKKKSAREKKKEGKWEYQSWCQVASASILIHPQSILLEQGNY